MEIVEIIVLALVQGLTEFLPISSSAHLILIPVITGWADQGLAFDVAVHVGTLLAVVSYFRHELRALWASGWASLLKGQHDANSRLAWGIVVATLPVVAAGLLFNDAVATLLRSPLVIALASIGFGLVLWWAYRVGNGQRSETELHWRDIILIGLAQALALIPGTSRSGITLSAGLLLGLKPEAAARFSFLLAIPTILGAGSLQTVELLSDNTTPVDWTGLIVGCALSALAAYLCIHYFLKLLNRIGLMPFVYYRLALGALLLALIYRGALQM